MADLEIVEAGRRRARKVIWSKENERNEVRLTQGQPFVSRAVAEAAWGSGDAHVQSTAMRQPRPQAFGARGAPNLTLGFAAKPSPSAPWARGLLSAFWVRGSPDLPACGPRRGSTSGPVRPIFVNQHSRPSRGAKPREKDECKTPEGIGTLRLAPEGRGVLCKMHLTRLS